MRSNRAAVISLLAMYLVIGLIAAGMLYPLFTILMTSLKNKVEVYNTAQVFPHHFQLRNYLVPFEMGWAKFFANSFLVTSVTTVVSLFLNSLAGYTFARMRFFGKQVLFAFILIGLMIPNQALLVPQFVLVRNLNWLNTYQGLIVPFISGSFGIFLMRQFFVTVPESLRESAKLEGGREFRIFASVFLPLSVASLTTLGILKATFTWNDFLYPLLFTDQEKLRTVQLALRFYVGQYSSPFHLLMAATVLISIPPIVLFFAFQKICPFYIL